MAVQIRVATGTIVLLTIAVLSIAGYRRYSTPTPLKAKELARQSRDTSDDRANQRAATLVATPASSPVGCGEGYVATEHHRCRPVDPATGAAYADAQLALFDDMRASPYIAEGNYFVPKLLTAAETRERQDLFRQMNEWADLIAKSQASEPQIEGFFKFRERLHHYRAQILTYQYVRLGGEVSPLDPALDHSRITDPELKARYAALEAEQRADFQQWTQARAAIGLPGQSYLANHPPRSP